MQGNAKLSYFFKVDQIGMVLAGEGTCKLNDVLLDEQFRESFLELGHCVECQQGLEAALPS